MGCDGGRSGVVRFGRDTDVKDTEGYKDHAEEVGGGRGADVVDIDVVDTDGERGHTGEVVDVEDIVDWG